MAGRPTDSGNRTCSLLVYGSLMHPQQRRHCGLCESPAIPVLLQGYARTFHQEPAWRTGQGDERGVLAVHPDPAARLNAILIGDVPESVIPALDRRERGYIRTPLGLDQLTPLGTDELPEPGARIYVYRGRPERYNAALRPQHAYRDLCIAAAAVWGERFEQMFLETTLVAGRPLRSRHV